MAPPNYMSAHAFLYSGGTMQDLGLLANANQSVALGINNRGQVVGWAGFLGEGMGAFLYSDGAMVDLNALVGPSSGWTLQEATGINDSGQIVGTGTNPSGQYDAFLLTPSPEPSTLCLSIVCGPLLLAFHLCRRRRGTQPSGGARG